MVNEDNEIDLQDLAVRLIRHFTRHIKLIAIFSFGGLILGATAWNFIPNVYESRMVIVSDILNEQHSDPITENFSRLIKEKNFKQLSLQLILSETDAAKIGTIRIEGLKREVPRVAESILIETIFTVDVETTDKEILPKLQDCIVNFLRKLEFVSVRVRQRQELNQKMVSKIEEEIQSLDSLKGRLFEGTSGSTRANATLMVDPGNIYKYIIELTKEQLTYKNKLELAEGVQVVEGLTPYEKPTFPKLSIFLVIGLLSGFTLAILYLVVKQLIKLASN